MINGDLSTLYTVILSLLGMIITAYSGYKIANNTNKKDHRQILSQDEAIFRKDLLIEIKSYRDEIKSLMVDVDLLREKYADLQVINGQLLIKISELTVALDRFTNAESSTSVTTTTQVTTHDGAGNTSTTVD